MIQVIAIHLNLLGCDPSRKYEYANKYIEKINESNISTMNDIIFTTISLLNVSIIQYLLDDYYLLSIYIYNFCFFILK